MLRIIIIKRIWWICPLFFLLGSCSESQKAWELESIGSSPYSRLSFRSNAFPKIILEILPLRGEMACFVTFSETRINSSSGTNAAITLRINHQTYEKTAALYEGDQRLGLNRETTDLLIQALQNGHMIEMEIGGYKTLISPESFSKNFTKLRNKKNSWDLSSHFRHL